MYSWWAQAHRAHLYMTHLCTHLAMQIRQTHRCSQEHSQQRQPCPAPLPVWAGQRSASESVSIYIFFYIRTHLCVYVQGRFAPAAGLRHSVCPAASSWIPVSPVSGFWMLKPRGHSRAAGAGMFLLALSWLAGTTLAPWCPTPLCPTALPFRERCAYTRRAGGTSPVPQVPCWAVRTHTQRL